MIIDTDQWIDTGAACDRLGIGRMQLWRLATNDRVRFVMVGRTPLYHMPSLIEYRSSRYTHSRAIPQSDDISYEDDTTMPNDDTLHALESFYAALC